MNVGEPGVVPLNARRIVGTYRYTSKDGAEYIFEMLRIFPTSSGAQSSLRIFKMEASGRWAPLSMRVGGRSLLYSKLATCWPPETLDSVSAEGGLRIVFHDIGAWERHFWPGGFDAPSLWEARYNDKLQLWTISRLRKLRGGEAAGLGNLL